ncbi:MAG: bifunctional heptose 7-phosphate kinase/heptose 1-phosphate adenyltransferase [Deltaproteobacteria bacterium]|jgi:D-beta-D-heptose 7-phosphate kinase/D-beta-D-heptose 1-phosphate adenosyltransferase|nr:bifunctional heptose 7-phosphate kinase/heptose 1-phosphate adenyltransferase [Deltaproteobacteria bacterium]
MGPQAAQSSAHTPAAQSELTGLQTRRVLVAGEVILDRYLWGEVERISPEAPVPVVRVTRRENRPGNSSFVMANLRALGARPVGLSLVGADQHGTQLKQALARLGVETRSILSDRERPTIVKLRILGSVQSSTRATQQLLRVDEEELSPVSERSERRLIARAEVELQRCHGVLVSDLNKGLLTPALLRALIDGARQRSMAVIIDPRLDNDYSVYRGATALTPNRYEAETVTGLRLSNPAAWRKAARMLAEKLDLAACLITLDRDGMYLSVRGGEELHIPTTPREVYDVTGAGDVVLSVFGLFTIAGHGFARAAELANLAAGLEVTHLGAQVISQSDLARALAAGGDKHEHKIVPAAAIGRLLAAERRKGRKVSFTNGCFDLLHAGHLALLSFARAQGDLLVVGLNSDKSVRQLKGDGRPVYPAGERARLLAALEAVSYVVVFNEARAEKIVRRVRPDILVKGEDWRGKKIDGGAFVESYGGRVMLAPLLPGHATTLTIDRLRGTTDAAKSPA